MKSLATFILFLVLTFSMRSQTLNKNAIKWPSFDIYYTPLYLKQFNPNNSLRIPLKKELTLHYQPQKLPFFCSFEDKSRNKLGVFLKLRAGNDESYMKMIKVSNH